jgi:hypothetical protein
MALRQGTPGTVLSAPSGAVYLGFDHDRKKAAPSRHAGQSAPRHQLVDVRAARVGLVRPFCGGSASDIAERDIMIAWLRD